MPYLPSRSGYITSQPSALPPEPPPATAPPPDNYIPGSTYVPPPPSDPYAAPAPTNYQPGSTYVPPAQTPVAPAPAPAAAPTNYVPGSTYVPPPPATAPMGIRFGTPTLDFLTPLGQARDSAFGTSPAPSASPSPPPTTIGMGAQMASTLMSNAPANSVAPATVPFGYTPYRQHQVPHIGPIPAPDLFPNPGWMAEPVPAIGMGASAPQQPTLAVYPPSSPPPAPPPIESFPDARMYEDWQPIESFPDYRSDRPQSWSRPFWGSWQALNGTPPWAERGDIDPSYDPYPYIPKEHAVDNRIRWASRFPIETYPDYRMDYLMRQLEAGRRHRYLQWLKGLFGGGEGEP